MKSIISAIKLLTIIPIDTKNRIQPGRMEGTLLCFPLVGLLLGGLCVGVLWLSGDVFPPGIAAALTVLALVVVTGALHLDGLADTADGLFGGATRERKLEIMRDARVGTFGIVAIAFLLGLKVLALASIFAQNGGVDGVFIASVMPVIGRWSILLAAGMCSYAREDEGTGRAAVEAAKFWHFLVWAPGVGVLLWLFFGAGGLVMLAVVLLVALTVIFYIRSRINGMTGDTLGAVCELSEMVLLLTFFVAAQLDLLPVAD